MPPPYNAIYKSKKIITPNRIIVVNTQTSRTFRQGLLQSSSPRFHSLHAKTWNPTWSLMSINKLPALHSMIIFIHMIVVLRLKYLFSSNDGHLRFLINLTKNIILNCIEDHIRKILTKLSFKWFSSSWEKFCLSILQRVLFWTMSCVGGQAG